MSEMLQSTQRMPELQWPRGRLWHRGKNELQQVQEHRPGVPHARGSLEAITLGSRSQRTRSITVMILRVLQSPIRMAIL